MKMLGQFKWLVFVLTALAAIVFLSLVWQRDIEINQLRIELDDATALQQESASRIAQSQQELLALRADNLKLVTHIAQSERSLLALVAQFEKSLLALQQELDLAEQQVASSEKKLDEALVSVTDLSAQVISLKQSNIDERQSLTRKKDELEEDLAAAIEGRELIKQRLRQEKSEFEEKVTLLRKENSELVLSSDTLRQEITELESDLQLAQQQQKVAAAQTPLEGASQEEYVELQVRFQQLNEHNEQLMSQFSTLSSTNTSLLNQLNDRTLEMRRLVDEKAALEGEWAELMSKSIWLETRLARSQQDTANLDTDLAYLRQDLEQIETEKRVLMQELGELKEASEVMEQNNNLLTVANQALTAEVKQSANVLDVHGLSDTSLEELQGRLERSELLTQEVE